MEAVSVSAFICVLYVVCSWGIVDGFIKYDTRSGIVEGKLNVHLVPHSHDDVGWLKTVDQYYVGSNNSIQGACVENVLDSVIMALLADPNRKFVFAEMAFFHRWWDEQNLETEEIVRKLVDAGQLEFMYALGFDSVHFARIDYQDRAKRKEDKSLEVVWRGSKTFGSTSQDNPLIYDYNVESRVSDFIDAAMVQANVTRTNHVMWTMGDDFQYQYAESWFKQMDKLLHYVNKDGRVNALYSTPSIYTEAKNAANASWPLKTDDYFPYADRANAYWTGYFTSRPGLKGYIRMLSGYYLAARQLEFLVGRRSTGPHTFSLGDALGIAQHHDAVTGTAKQHTTNDYAKRLAIGASEAEAVVSSALSCLVSSGPRNLCAKPMLTLNQARGRVQAFFLVGCQIINYAILRNCQLLNISFCPPTEEDIPEGKSLVVVAYNPLGWNRTQTIRIPVKDANLIVQDSTGNTIEAQYMELDNVTRNLRNFYTKAYLGNSPQEVPKYWLFFQASVPPLGWSTYFISKMAGQGTGKRRIGYVPVMDLPQNETVEIGPGSLKMSFSSTSGQLQRIFNSKTGVDVPVQQSYLWYGSSGGDADPQRSGAYIFRPNGAPPAVVSRSVPLKVIRGPLVDEVHQQFSSWIYQVVRLYKDKDHAEFEFTIGPIPTYDGVGKEVITRITANMATEKVFYTDSNGRDFLKRVRDYRADWPLSVTQPVAGNYYPLNLGLFTMDKKAEMSVLVDRAIGGASIEDGELELMLHRRIIYDDSRGVGEALAETVCVNSTCEGLTVRGNYYLSINQLGAGSRWRRITGQEIYSPFLLAFTHEKLEDWKSSHLMKATTMDPNYSLPLNVALITLQELEDGSVLLRLAHLYEAGEDSDYSTLAKVELKKIFSGKMIKAVTETSLSANQDKSEMKRMAWKVEGDSGGEPAPVKGGPLDNSTLIVELGPMEIRTLLLSF
ncbi:hypothetical protein RJ639_016343 [Escallonia herrerae]|uniref:Alpha-mannosidase n=1 Tax=Escallonia herrerae TaxID=1293975 RepID=A0AA89AK26_9ASTE|nr:hypothetical protein RJ639_016343 [Escallonia herrerae]